MRCWSRLKTWPQSDGMQWFAMGFFLLGLLLSAWSLRTAGVWGVVGLRSEKWCKLIDRGVEYTSAEDGV